MSATTPLLSAGFNTGGESSYEELVGPTIIDATRGGRYGASG